MDPVISEMKYLGGATLDFIEVRIPDDYPDPENLVLVIYDRNHDGSATATPSASDMFAIAAVGNTDDDVTADGLTHYTIGSDYNGDAIALHANDAVGLYNAATGETYGLYSFGNSYTVSDAALQPDGIAADPFAGEDTTVLPTTASIGDSLVRQADGTYTPTTSPTPGTSIVCFCDGTEILTDTGLRLIEDLSIGDLVFCKDKGFKPIRWIGRRWFDLTQELDPSLVPIRFEKGALGPQLPTQDLFLSPNHCVQIEHSLCSLYFAVPEMFFPAKHLVGIQGINKSDKTVFGYFHILFDDHEMIQANGIWAESLFFGDTAKIVMGSEKRQELLSVFPELTATASKFQTRLPVSKKHEATIFTQMVNQHEAPIYA
ncbi:MAG: Hint domain-containing protein [Sulfitobacter sp.]